jgi:hypothetical protein
MRDVFKIRTVPSVGARVFYRPLEVWAKVVRIERASDGVWVEVARERHPSVGASYLWGYEFARKDILLSGEPGCPIDPTPATVREEGPSSDQAS